jgi:hypothetical protein
VRLVDVVPRLTPRPLATWLAEPEVLVPLAGRPELFIPAAERSSETHNVEVVASGLWMRPPGPAYGRDLIRAAPVRPDGHVLWISQDSGPEQVRGLITALDPGVRARTCLVCLARRQIPLGSLEGRRARPVLMDRRRQAATNDYKGYDLRASTDLR